MSKGPGNGGDVESFLRGDPIAIDVLRAAVALAVRSFQFPDPGLNEDLVQETLTRVFVNLTAGQFRGESSLATYARRVARYTCLEHLRRRRHATEIDPEAVPSAERWSRPDESFLWTEEHLRNLQIFSSLPEDCRRLLRMIFVEGRSYRETGRRLGLTEGAVKTRVHRCRASFREAAGLRRTIPIRSLPRKAGE
jgi:RNA polymerase sigma-70 factor (ECF subfamily)